MSEPVYMVVDESVATVVLNRPDKLNALNLQAWELIGRLFETLHEDDSIRCVILRGTDERAFSAGADIAAFSKERHTDSDVRNYGRVIDTTLTAIRECRHPVIAAIRGVCVGGGLELSSACDLRICGESSRFGAPINRLGLTMSYAEVKTLTDIAGSAGALEILLCGDVFGAKRAYELGLVSRVAPDEDLLNEACSLARQISERAPLVNRWHKKFVRRLADPVPLSQKEIDEGFAAYATEDYETGCKAFISREKPIFKGR